LAKLQKEIKMLNSESKIGLLRSFLRRTQYSLAFTILCFQSCVDQMLSRTLDHFAANNVAFVAGAILILAMVETSIFFSEKRLKEK
jgi:hypothetical protein